MSNFDQRNLESEYYAAVADAAERELASMTERMRKRTGNPLLSFG